MVLTSETKDYSIKANRPQYSVSYKNKINSIWDYRIGNFLTAFFSKQANL